MLLQKSSLTGGERLTEILKQPQYSPIDVYKQVMVLKAGTSGRLDKYPTSKLLHYQAELFDYLDDAGASVMQKLRASGAIDEELGKEVEALFDDFEQHFRPDTVTGGIDSGYTVKLAMAMSQRSSRINRDMLKLVERVTSRELASPSLEKELEQIIAGDDVLEKDRFNELIENCEIMDYEKSSKMETLFKLASKKMAKEHSDISAKEFYDKLITREESSSTALSPFFALPHIVIEGKKKFQLLIVRSRRGIRFTETSPEVHAMFFLAGSIDQRHFHLVVISTLALIVNHPSFEDSWLKASTAEELKQLIPRIKELSEKQG